MHSQFIYKKTKHFFNAKVVLDNPTYFRNPFQFEITFECLHELDDDLEWKVVYVGSAEDTSRDQILEEVLVGPVPVGVNKFVLQADAPDPSSIAKEDVLGVTVVLVTCSYKNQEFARVGYYVNNEMEYPPGTEFDEDGNPVNEIQVDFDKLTRQILADKPRVTRFPIDWSGSGDQQVEVNMSAEDRNRAEELEKAIEDMDETLVDDEEEEDDEEDVDEMDLGDEDDDVMVGVMAAE